MTVFCIIAPTTDAIYGNKFGMPLGIGANLEAVTAQYVDVRLGRKKSVLDVYHKALHPTKGDGERRQSDGGKEEKSKKKSSDIEL